jgi:predicted kinase
MNIEDFDTIDVLLVCGLPGSGKSHFAREYCRRGDRKRINRKEIRRHLFEMTSFGEQWHEELFNEDDEHLVKHVERKLIEHLLHKNEKVLIDNVSVTAESRKTYTAIADHFNRSIGVIFLNPPLQICLERNRNRPDQVPELAITNLYASINLPARKEGFRNIMIISNY